MVEQIRQDYETRVASDRVAARAALAAAEALGHTFNADWVARWFTTGPHLWVARCSRCHAVVICRGGRYEQPTPFAHGDALQVHCSGQLNVPGEAVAAVAQENPWATAEALAAQNGHVLHGWRNNWAAHEGINCCSECDATLLVTIYKDFDQSSPHTAKVRKIEGRALTHRCAGGGYEDYYRDPGKLNDREHLLKAPIAPQQPKPQQSKVANPLYVNLPLIVRLLGVDDAGEFGAATCPHCGAEGRYIYNFITENGERGGAMAGCFRRFPIHPFASLAAGLEERERKAKASYRELSSWDRQLLQALEAFYAGSLDEAGVYAVIYRVKQSKAAWATRRGYR